jgi:glycosyltransferase involved in cell wall biosynthesis
MNIDDILKSKISIFAHFNATGATEELRDWLIGRRIRELVYIAFPFGIRPGNKERGRIQVYIYKRGKLFKRKNSFLSFYKPEFISFIKDFIYCIYYGILFCSKTDILFGGDNLLTIAGNILKRLGITKKTIYYMIDYTPVRYKNPFINRLYYSFDRSAAQGSDSVWPLCERTIGGRFDDGRLTEERVRWYPVPYGNHSQKFSLKLCHNKNSIVYMGGLEKNKGAEFIIELAKYLSFNHPEFHITVIGGGSYGHQFSEEIKEKKLENIIDYKGYIDQFEDVMDILSHCGIAIAPYYPYDKNNFTYYADPGKLKTYLGAGLPVILTAVPSFSRTIEESGAGLISGYDVENFGEKLFKILENYESFEKNAILLGRKFDWDIIFKEAFRKIRY